MASNFFNLNTAINDSGKWAQSKYTAAEQAAEYKELEDEKRAREAISEQSGNSFLRLTLQGKIKEAFAEAGYGERVAKQIADSALNVVGQVITPLEQWLEEYEPYYTENMFAEMMNPMLKQMFFQNQMQQQDIKQRLETGELAGGKFNAMY